MPMVDCLSQQYFESSRETLVKVDSQMRLNYVRRKEIPRSAKVRSWKEQVSQGRTLEPNRD